MAGRRWWWSRWSPLVGVCLLGACSSSEQGTAGTASPSAVTTTSVAATVPSTSVVSATTTPATTMPVTTMPATTAPATSVPATTTTAVPETTTTTTSTTTVPAPAGTPYGMPVADGTHAGYSHEHHDYPASDVFVPGGCGSTIIAPVNGVVLEARRVDAWSSTVDNPATRGGKSVAILGDDGVRYYLAHFQDIDAAIEPGVRVGIGQTLGLMGRTGRAGACHVHFAISPPCPGKEWSVRRGVIFPWRYLDAWRRGEQLSPVAEVEQWSAAHPDACAQAMADPNAADA